MWDIKRTLLAGCANRDDDGLPAVVSAAARRANELGYAPVHQP